MSDEEHKPPEKEADEWVEKFELAEQPDDDATKHILIERVGTVSPDDAPHIHRRFVKACRKAAVGAYSFAKKKWIEAPIAEAETKIQKARQAELDTAIKEAQLVEIARNIYDEKKAKEVLQEAIIDPAMAKAIREGDIRELEKSFLELLENLLQSKGFRIKSVSTAPTAEELRELTSNGAPSKNDE